MKNWTLYIDRFISIIYEENRERPMDTLFAPFTTGAAF